MLRQGFIVSLALVVSSWSDAPSCLWDIETHFFQEKTVKESFDLYHVFQSEWTSILTDIYRNVQTVPQRVRLKAQAMRPNPLEHPYDAEKIKAILYEVEFEVFRESLLAHYYYDLSATYGMFDYIRTHQEARVNACLDRSRLKK